MKRKICLSVATLITLTLAGCSKNEISDADSIILKQELQQLSGEIKKLNTKIKDTNRDIASLEALIPKQNTGEFTVTAAKLNMRQGATIDAEVIGTLNYGTKLNVIDTSNPLWYKVSVDLGGYAREDKEYTTSFLLNENSIEVKNNYLNEASTFYVSSKYLNSDNIETLQETPKGDRPFTYGLLFFDYEIKNILENEIWNNMKSDLEALGYTGIDVVPINRDTYESDVKSGKFDAVESASGQFAKVISENPSMQAFAKDVINGETNYSGIVIVNKDSGITDFKQLKGKNVLTGKELSESSYRYQKYYLEEIHGIDMEKDMKLEKDNYHQVIFHKVATGEASVGFCGDFVMTDSFGNMKENLIKSKIKLDSKEELDKLRDNVIVMDMKELDPIPNNPHSIRNELYSNKELVTKLYDSVKKVYSKNKEDYDLVEANNKEYEMLVELE